MKTQAIIPAAGAGSRMKSSTCKPLVEIKGKPLLIHCLETFESCDLVDSIIVVGPAEHIEDFKKALSRFGLHKVIHVVEGGKERSDSVLNGIKALDEDTDIVVIHDGARPLVTEELISRAVTACQEENAVIAAVPVKPTIKRIDRQTMTVVATLDRQLMWEAQTPQVFKKELLLKAHKASAGRPATDDAMLVEMLGEKVKVIEGQYSNIKVTTDEDIRLAQALLEKEQVAQ